MTRVMIDTTNTGFSSALGAIDELDAEEIVAVYDTGSGAIAVTQADLDRIPSDLIVVAIDQGFTGSPNMKANIRDCENGAWTLANAVKKEGWNVTRPTLYLGYPDTVTEAYNLGWRGDVWIAKSSNTPPLSPPDVPEGIIVVAEQWNYTDPDYDVSVVFDPTWPEAKMATPVTPQIPPGPWNPAEDYPWRGATLTVIGSDDLIHVYEYVETTGQWLRIDTRADI